MPESGSQIVLCDLPIRLDTYRGCAHACTYCFARKKKDMEEIIFHEGAKALKDFIGGKRNSYTNWCDWDIPIHWGGLSDPFQPAEKKHGLSYECLKVFANTGYPVVISTKGRILASQRYLDVLFSTRAVVQVSMMSPKYDELEPGAPSFKERMDMLEALAVNSLRLIIRLQPYAVGLVDDIVESLPRYKDAGVFGVTIEGMKRTTKREGWVKVTNDWVYPVRKLFKDYQVIKDECHALDLAFYCAENRLRSMGDNPCCCGANGLDGFEVNQANMNHMHGKDETITYTEEMNQPGTASVFKGLEQSAGSYEFIKTASYKDCMEILKNVKSYRETMGLRIS